MRPLLAMGLMQGHQNDVRQLYLFGKQSDSYAKHFASLKRYTTCGDIPTPEEQRNDYTISVLWQGNPISAVKSFSTHNCALCTRERLAILKASRSKPELLINSCDEIYGACKHKNPSFIGLLQTTPPALMSHKKTKKSCQQKSPQR